MTIDEYAIWAAKVGRTLSVGTKETSTLSYLGLGLAGETGEVVELIKRVLRDGKLDQEKMADELGDVAYYWARLCLASGCTPSDVLKHSMQKVEARLAHDPNRRGLLSGD